MTGARTCNALRRSTESIWPRIERAVTHPGSRRFISVFTPTSLILSVFGRYAFTRRHSGGNKQAIGQGKVSRGHACASGTGRQSRAARLPQAAGSHVTARSRDHCRTEEGVTIQRRPAQDVSRFHSGGPVGQGRRVSPFRSDRRAVFSRVAGQFANGIAGYQPDAVLLILAALDDDSFGRLMTRARELDLDVLCEVHDEKELQRALDGGAEIVGVNNRDL